MISAKTLGKLKETKRRELGLTYPLIGENDQCQRLDCFRTGKVVEAIMSKLTPLIMWLNDGGSKPLTVKGFPETALTCEIFEERRQTSEGTMSLLRKCLPEEFLTKLEDFMFEEGPPPYRFQELQEIYPIDTVLNYGSLAPNRCLCEIILHRLALLLVRSHQCLSKLCKVELPLAPLNRQKFYDFKRALFTMLLDIQTVVSRFPYKNKKTRMRIDGELELRKRGSVFSTSNVLSEAESAMKIILPRVRCEIIEDVIHQLALLLVLAKMKETKLPVPVRLSSTPYTQQKFDELKRSLITEYSWGSVVALLDFFYD